MRMQIRKKPRIRKRGGGRGEGGDGEEWPSSHNINFRNWALGLTVYLFLQQKYCDFHFYIKLQPRLKIHS